MINKKTILRTPSYEEVTIEIRNHQQGKSKANLSNMDLRGFLLNDLDLSGANLSYSNVEGVSFKNTNLDGANTTGTKGFNV